MTQIESLLAVFVPFFLGTIEKLDPFLEFSTSSYAFKSVFVWIGGVLWHSDLDHVARRIAIELVPFVVMKE